MAHWWRCITGTTNGPRPQRPSRSLPMADTPSSSAHLWGGPAPRKRCGRHSTPPSKYHADTHRRGHLVSNAGTVIYGTIDSVGEDDFDLVFAVNAKAPFFIVKHGAGRPARRWPRHQYLFRCLARRFPIDDRRYSMTKGAINALTHARWRAQLAPREITVNSVEPGINTNRHRAVKLARRTDERPSSGMVRIQPKIGAPDDIADVVAFLASPDSHGGVTRQFFIHDASGGLLPLRVTVKVEVASA